MKVRREDEEKSIMNADNITADAFSYAPSSQREKPNAIFTSDKLEKSDKLDDTIDNLKINDAGYDLNTATMSDAQDNITSYIDTVTHTSNIIVHQTLLIFWTIGEVSVLTTPTNLMIAAIRLAQWTLLMTVVKEIFADTTLGNAWTNRNRQQISRTSVDGSIPISTPIHSEMRKSSSTEPNDSNSTRIPIGTSYNNTAPPCGLNMSP